jgi:hypothetical protein
VLFAGRLLVGLAGGRALASLPPALRWSRATCLLETPGSPIPLIVIGIAFATKYVGTVALALNNARSGD